MERNEKPKGQLSSSLFAKRKQGAENTSKTSDIIGKVTIDNNNEKDQLDFGLHKEIDSIPSSSESDNNEAADEKAYQIKIPDIQISRRKFLMGTGLLAAAGALGFITKGKFPFLGESGSEKEAKNGTMVLSEEETILQKEMVKVLNWVPDGPITYWTTKEGKRRYLLTGGQDNATYMLETDGTKTLRDTIQNDNLTKENFSKVYSPDENIDYKKHYVGITSVLQMDKDNPDHLFGVAHCEKRVDRNASGTFTATIEFLESLDAGSTWKSKGPIIKGMEPQEPGERASGAGQPTAIFNPEDGYAYVLYIDWAAGKNVKHPDQIYLARIKPQPELQATRLEYWTDDGFSSDEIKSKSVIPVPDEKDFIYTALPNVSWNEHLNQYICTGESDNGFWFTKSKNLTEWSEPEIIYDFTDRGGKPHSILQVGEKWDSYPTALDETKPNSQITGKNGIFYHSSGDNVISHEPAAVDFEIIS